jgi:hypothetical protein
MRALDHPLGIGVLHRLALADERKDFDPHPLPFEFQHLDQDERLGDLGEARHRIRNRARSSGRCTLARFNHQYAPRP